jgi:hypothetical protein
MRRRCCLCGKVHDQCSAFTLAQDGLKPPMPREVCQGCAELNALLWSGNCGVPWYRRRRWLWKFTLLRWAMLWFNLEPTQFLVGRRV